MRELIFKKKKVIVVVLVLCIYFALLALLSFVRAPKESKAVGGSILQSEYFSVTAEEGKLRIDADGLHFDDAENTLKLFSAPISLREFQQIEVSFAVCCPEDYTGAALLHVDLYEDGYDSEDQDFAVELRAGKNEITQVIDKGSNAPDEAQFRIFCLEATQCDISDLSVKEMEESSQRIGEISCIITIVILSILLSVVVLHGREKEGKSLSDSG